METWDAFTSRRNVRQFTDRVIPEDALDRILEAGRRAPSSRNWQPWDFVVVTDRDQLRELSKVWRGAGHVADSAATVVLVVEDATQDRAQYDLGQATLAMMLVAADQGIGSGHAVVEDQRALVGRALASFQAPRSAPALGPRGRSGGCLGLPALPGHGT